MRPCVSPGEVGLPPATQGAAWAGGTAEDRGWRGLMSRCKKRPYVSTHLVQQPKEGLCVMELAPGSQPCPRYSLRAGRAGGSASTESAVRSGLLSAAAALLRLRNSERKQSRSGRGKQAGKQAGFLRQQLPTQKAPPTPLTIAKGLVGCQLTLLKKEILLDSLALSPCTALKITPHSTKLQAALVQSPEQSNC